MLQVTTGGCKKSPNGGIDDPWFCLRDPDVSHTVWDESFHSKSTALCVASRNWSMTQRKSSLFDGSSHVRRCILQQFLTAFVPLPVVQVCSTFTVQISFTRKEGRRGTIALQRVTAEREVDMVSGSIQEMSSPFSIPLLWNKSAGFAWNSVLLGPNNTTAYHSAEMH